MNKLKEINISISIYHLPKGKNHIYMRKSMSNATIGLDKLSKNLIIMSKSYFPK